MSFQEVSEFSRSWGLVFLMIVFGAAVVYAFWPSNRSRFHDAARIPLQRDGEP
jgi:cytochrome c oxidase cbb3-type subunit 4